MRDNFKQILKDAARSSLAVLTILALLQPFGLNLSEGRMLIIGITIINFLCNIIIALLLQPIKDFKIRTICGNIIFIPVFSAVYIMFHSYSQSHCFWDCNFMTYLKVCMWVCPRYPRIDPLALLENWPPCLSHDNENWGDASRLRLVPRHGVRRSRT